MERSQEGGDCTYAREQGYIEANVMSFLANAADIALKFDMLGVARATNKLAYLKLSSYLGELLPLRLRSFWSPSA